MKYSVPVVSAQMTLLSETKSRKFLSGGTYRPHIVIGPVSQRVALVSGGVGTEHYLGVAFVGGPEAIHPGETAEVRFALMYFPDEPYKAVVPGASFTVREGAVVVGFGTGAKCRPTKHSTRRPRLRRVRGLISALGRTIPMIYRFMFAAYMALALVPTARALELSFYGKTPTYVAGGKVDVASGVLPGTPVLFETAGPSHTILRPATPSEIKSRKQTLYTFEWQQDKIARFYELVDPAVVKRLSDQNVIDTASPDGQNYELSAIKAFFNDAKVLQKCLPPEKSFKGTIAAYVVVSEKGEADQTIVLPEGGVAECITESANKKDLPRPPHPFTASAHINIKD